MRSSTCVYKSLFHQLYLSVQLQRSLSDDGEHAGQFNMLLDCNNMAFRLRLESGNACLQRCKQPLRRIAGFALGRLRGHNMPGRADTEHGFSQDPAVRERTEVSRRVSRLSPLRSHRLASLLCRQHCLARLRTSLTCLAEVFEFLAINKCAQILTLVGNVGILIIPKLAAHLVEVDLSCNGLVRWVCVFS